jgi:outer membrane protein TolC
MGTALAQNLDLRQAAARIDEARALRDRVAGDRLPTVSRWLPASIGAVKARTAPCPWAPFPALTPRRPFTTRASTRPGRPTLFGAKRRALEGASARLQATEVEAQGVRMRIVAEVARTWFTAVGAGYELHAQQATLDTLQQTLELVRLRHAIGRRIRRRRGGGVRAVDRSQRAAAGHPGTPARRGAWPGRAAGRTAGA